MQSNYKPLITRTPDTQYRDRLAFILKYGILTEKTPQGVAAITCFGTLPQMVFDLSNGVPLITERALPSWKSAVGEVVAFINGARTIDEIESYGVNPAFWSPYRGKGYGPDKIDMGPGSYGAVFHDLPMPDGSTFNQLQNIVDQIKQFPDMRSHRVTNWIPYYTRRGEGRRVIVTPCHGTMHWRVIQGKLHLHMKQDSADMPIGVPHNMIQYAALLLMMCQVTGYKPGNYIHSFSDAHIYENQVEKVKELIERPAKPFPTMYLYKGIEDLFEFRLNHFSIEEYDPHPGMKIPYAP